MMLSGMLIKMPSVFTEQLIAQYGPPGKYRFNDTPTTGTATTLRSGAIQNVSRVMPWQNTQAGSILAYHPVAWWSDLTVTIHALPGVYGRMCTFYGGWGAAGAPTPQTLSDMMALHGAFTRTWGGTGDPGTSSATVPCVFNDTMTDTLKTPYNDGVRAVFYYCFFETALTDKAPDSDRFMLQFVGSFNVQGTY
jgi:hypothetical protein